MPDAQRNAAAIGEAAAKQLLREGWTFESTRLNLYLVGPHGERLRYVESRRLFVSAAEVEYADAA